MLNVPIDEFKKRTQFYLDKIKSGETLIIEEEENPIAKVAPMPEIKVENRPMGLAEGDFIVPEDFNSPLPSKIINLFK